MVGVSRVAGNLRFLPEITGLFLAGRKMQLQPHGGFSLVKTDLYLQRCPHTHTALVLFGFKPAALYGVYIQSARGW